MILIFGKWLRLGVAFFLLALVAACGFTGGGESANPLAQTEESERKNKRKSKDRDRDVDRNSNDSKGKKPGEEEEHEDDDPVDERDPDASGSTDTNGSSEEGDENGGDGEPDAPPAFSLDVSEEPYRGLTVSIPVTMLDEDVEIVSYQVDIAVDEDCNDPVVSVELAKTPLVVSVPEPGEYVACVVGQDADGNLVPSANFAVPLMIQDVPCNTADRWVAVPNDQEYPDVSIYGAPSDVALDSKGRWLLTGSSGGRTFVGRLLANGDRDPSFGENGVVVHDVFANGPDGGRFVTEAADGKIVVVGSLQTGRGRLASINRTWSDMTVFTAMRFNADGTWDESFNTDSANNMNVIVDDETQTVNARSGLLVYWPKFYYFHQFLSNLSHTHQMTGMTVDKEGNIFVASSTHDRLHNFSADMIRPDGSIGTRGILRAIVAAVRNQIHQGWNSLNTQINYVNSGERVSGVSMDSDCKFLATGWSSYTQSANAYYHKPVLTRSQPSAQGEMVLDPEFNPTEQTNGQIYYTESPFAETDGHAIGAIPMLDGSIAWVMSYHAWRTPHVIKVVRVMPNGQIDPNFTPTVLPSSGEVEWGGIGENMLRDADGKVTFAVNWRGGGSTVFRINSDLSLDTTFEMQGALHRTTAVSLMTFRENGALFIAP